MAAQAQVSLEEYLGTSFDGADREFLDGEIVERNVGDIRHSKAQLELGSFFHGLTEELSLRCFPELRVRLGPKRYRVADLAVYAGGEPAERYPSSPPLVIVEILSPDDRYTEILDKLEDYRRWGVAHIWFVDPSRGKLHVYGEGGLREVEAFRIPDYQVEIPPAKVFR